MRGENVGRASATGPVVVLGFGAAAVSALCALREAGFAGPVTVVTDAGPEPYSPVLTSYYAGGRIGYGQCFPWKDLDFEALIDDLVTASPVEAVDAGAREVVLPDGRRIGYAKLLIATGAHPVAPGFPATAPYRPLVLRTMADADRLREALEGVQRKSVLVAGTSMVGLKVLEACLDRGGRATMLGRSAHILRSSAHSLVAERLERLLVERGVALRLSQAAVSAAAHDGTRGCTVRFDNGDAEAFDEVVLAQGARPNLAFVRDSAVEVREGVVVDRFMRTSAPDVFAAGDVAQALDLSSGRERVIGLWQNAVQQGRCAGAAIAAELAGRAPTRPYPGSIPSNTIHVQDILFSSAGALAEGEGTRIEASEAGGALTVRAYAYRRGKKQLVGFNVLAVATDGGLYGDAVDEIGAYRREILNAYL